MMPHGAVEKFKQKSNNGALKLYKLHGKMKQYHAFSANFSYRVTIKIEKQKVYYMDIGDHGVYE